MLDNLKELRKKGKGDSPKGRKVTNDIKKLLNNVKDAVSTAMTNYETSIITQKPSTSSDQQQARLLKEPDQPDSRTLKQVQCPSNFPYYYNYHGAGDYCCSVKPNNWPQSRDDGCPSSALECPGTYCTDYSVSSTADKDLIRFELKFDDVNEQNFEYLKEDLKTRIANVLDNYKRKSNTSDIILFKPNIIFN